MFNVGDTVKYVNPSLSLFGCIGKVTKSYPLNDQYEVDFKTGSMYGKTTFMCSAKEIELVTTLPIGNQIPLGSASLLMDEALDDVSNLFGVHEDLPDYKSSAPFCDCGGYKVFGTMSSEAHSPWCSIFTKN